MTSLPVSACYCTRFSTVGGWHGVGDSGLASNHAFQIIDHHDSIKSRPSVEHLNNLSRLEDFIQFSRMRFMLLENYDPILRAVCDELQTDMAIRHRLAGH
jgi:hypothetical protein